MHYMIKASIKTLLACALSCTFLYANTQENIPEVDEKLMDTMLSRLIYGVKCSEMKPISVFDPSVLWVYDKNNIDAQKVPEKIRFIHFAGKMLLGGIADNNNAYISADKEFSYSLQGNDLVVSNICDKQQFTLSNFDKEKENFHIKLSEKGGREVAIVINVAESMRDYVFAFKEIAPFIAKHILEDNKDSYSKITLVTFTSLRIEDYNDVLDTKDFLTDVKNVKTLNSQTRLVNYALIRAMRHFTKDNGLKKEIYLITDGTPSDMPAAEQMLKLTKNLNNNIVRNSNGSKDNWVTIHTLALNKNLNVLKELTEATGGSFYEPKTMYEFRKLFLRLSNNGKDVEPKEIGYEMRSMKINKLYDPDNPDGSSEK